MRHFFGILASALLIVSLCFAATMIAKEEVQTFKLDPNVNYVAGKIVVKFKTGMIPISATINKMGIATTGIASLDMLNQSFKVSAIEKQFARTKPPPPDSRLPDLSRFYTIKFDRSMNLEKVLDAYTKNPVVETAEPIGIHRAHSTPNDPIFSNQWYLNQSNNRDIDGPEAWDINPGTTTAVIAIVDSGVLYSHPDLGGFPPHTNGNIWINGDEYIGESGEDDDGNGYTDDIFGWDWVTDVTEPYQPYCTSLMPGEDYLDEDNDPSDYNGHGTHCAGIAAAMTNNEIGVAGIAGGWYPNQRGCQIMCLRVACSQYCPMIGGELAWTTMDVAAQAFIYAADMGATVINFSYGSDHTSFFEAAIDYAIGEGVIFTKSAGNGNETFCDYMACRSDVLTVGSTDQSDKKSGFSDYGPWVDVFAPGSSIYSTFSDHYNAIYAYGSGTSMAAPMVAGLCGLLKSQNPGWGSDEIKAAILNYAESIDCLNPGYEGMLGTGRINAFNSLDGSIKNYPCVQMTDKGTVSSGNINHTRASDNVYEAITEELQPQGGNPKRRKSVLDKRWTFDVAGGASVTFYLEAHQSANNENDHFIFEYSTDGTTYNYITTVDSTNDVLHEISLPNTLNGTVYIRATDTDQTVGNLALDTIYIDHFYIESVPGPPVPEVVYGSHIIDNGNGRLDPGETANMIVTLNNIGSANATTVAANLTESDVYITVITGTATFGDIPSEGAGNNSGNPYVVSADPCTPEGHQVEFSLDISADGGYTNTDTFSLTVGQQQMYVFSIEMSCEITRTAGPNEFQQATAIVTIKDTGDNPVEGASVYGQWSGPTTDSDSGQTNINGQVTLRSDEVKNPINPFYFCVNGVVKEGWVYDPGLNIETCDTIAPCSLI